MVFDSLRQELDSRTAAGEIKKIENGNSRRVKGYFSMGQSWFVG
jgi:hypothetical protein